MRLTWGFIPVLFCQLALAQGVVSIYPSPLSTTPGTATQFVIYNTTGGTGVTWSVNGVTGGNSTVGTITAAGLYTAPAAIPTPNVVTVKAASTPSGINGTSAVSIMQPTPNVWSSSPSSFSTGPNQTMSLNGSNFVPTSTVSVGEVAFMATYMSSTSLKATGNLLTAGTFKLTVTNPGNGATTSSPINITVKVAAPPPVSVTVSPASATVALSASQPFTASVSNTANTAVTWTATAGTITPAGVYTAPATMPASQVVTITATSQADTTKSAIASVLLQSYAGPTGSGNGADLHAGRFLEQAAFGPSPADLAFIHQNTTTTADGIDAWLANQFAMAPSVISLPASNSNVGSDTLHRISTAPDQLRQKVVWACLSSL